MGQAGTAATDGTRGLMERVQTANDEVLIDLASADARCTLPTPMIAADDSGDGSQLCRRGARQPGDFAVKRWSKREFAPSLAVIDGISAYLGAVDAIVTRKPLDLVTEVADAEAKLRALSGDLTAIAGAPALPTLTGDQQAAIDGTLRLLSEIVDEAQRVDKLRDIELRNDPATFAASLDALDRVNETMVNALNGQILHQRTLTTLELARLGAAPAEERKPIYRRQLDLIDVQDSLPDLRTALATSVAVFRKAHADYRELLFDTKARLSPAEKRKKASIIQARVLGALQNLASLVKAF